MPNIPGDLLHWLVLPLLIFAARICDVSLGTIRIIFISRGIKLLASLIGFFEILIWLTALSQIMQHLDQYYYFLAYAAGFASGTYIGMAIENKIAMGVCLIRIITQAGAESLITELKEAGCGVTSIAAQGIFRPVHVVFSIVKRKDLKRIIEIVKRNNPQAIYTIEDVRFANQQVFGNLPGNLHKPPGNFFAFLRKGK